MLKTNKNIKTIKTIKKLIVHESKRAVPVGVTHNMQLPHFNQNIVKEITLHLIKNGTITAILVKEKNGLWTIVFD